jgi:hypothetical protein
VNKTTALDGLQIGLINLNGRKEPFGFLPIVNWSGFFYIKLQVVLSDQGLTVCNRKIFIWPQGVFTA